MSKPENPQAFPGEHTATTHEDNHSTGMGMVYEFRAFDEGMTLLDYFAGQALVSMVSVAGEPLEEKSENTGKHRTIARMSYLYAEAMLAERERRLT